MESAIALAVKLMLTGMSTVFLILVLVVFLGKLIILITNKYPASAPVGSKPLENGSSIDPKKLAAIVSAVEVATKGKGSITSINKMN